MMKRILFLIALYCFTASQAASALEIEGIQIPEQVQLGEQTLVLNGAGVRTKFFFDIYIGALYLPKPETSAQAILQSHQPKQVTLYMLFGHIPRDRFVDGWERSFEKSSHGHLDELRQRLDTFKGFFHDMKRDDILTFDFTPDGQTTIHLNHQVIGSISGEDFQHAVLSAWLGKTAADKDLQRKMLGK